MLKAQGENLIHYLQT